jgi:hypothetical protein
MKTNMESLDEALIAVWRQSLVDEANVVELGAKRYPVTTSEAKHLRQVAFDFDGESFMGIQQNPKTRSRWASMARLGQKVMQFIRDGRYVAVVVDGEVILYGKRTT